MDVIPARRSSAIFVPRLVGMGMGRKGSAICLYCSGLNRWYSIVLFSRLFRSKVSVGRQNARKPGCSCGAIRVCERWPEHVHGQIFVPARRTVARRGFQHVRSQALVTSQTLALALSLTWPSCISTEYSTASQLCCFRISLVFFLTNVAKESRLPETFSPDFFFASVNIL